MGKWSLLRKDLPSVSVPLYVNVQDDMRLHENLVIGIIAVFKNTSVYEILMLPNRLIIFSAIEVL